MGYKLFIGTPECKTKLSSKLIGMRYVKMHGFHSMATPYMILENEW